MKEFDMLKKDFGGILTYFPFACLTGDVQGIFVKDMFAVIGELNIRP